MSYRFFIVIIYCLSLTNFVFSEKIPVVEIETNDFSISNFELGLIVDESRNMKIDDILNNIGLLKVVNSRYEVPSNPNINCWFIFKT